MSPFRPTFRSVLFMVPLAAHSAAAATRFVATSGTDSPANGSQAAPYRTIGYGLEHLASGDELVIADGVYEGLANYINDGLHAIPSGGVAGDTRIRAEHPFAVRIRNLNDHGYYDAPLRLRGTQVRVDGIVFDLIDNADTPAVGFLEGSYHRITRSIFRRQGAVETYGSWLSMSGDHFLVEDVGGVGAARYGFELGGPDDTSHQIILRRVVGRFDFSSSLQPKATFAAYGNNDGFNVRQIWYQNCIALDGQRGPGAGGEEHYGAWYFPKNLDDGRITGSIALNNRTAYAGLFVQELQGRNTQLTDVVSWANDGAGVRWNGTGATTLSNLTLGAQPSALYNDNGTTLAVLRNSWFRVDVGQSLFQTNTGFAEFTHNVFLPQTTFYGTSIVTPSGPLRYLPDASDGTGTSNVGATILKRFGASGTVWGEPGYDLPTSEDLWPWPYEDQLKAVFAEANTALPGNTPASNITVRGFTAATDPYGQPQTLTRYVWQFLGQRIPDAVYKGAAVFADGFE